MSAMRRTCSLFLAVCALAAVRGASAQLELQLPVLQDQVRQGGAVMRSLRMEPAEQAAGGRVVAIVELEALEPYYVRADSLKFSLAGETPAGITVERVQLPAAKHKYDKWIEKDVAYLDGVFSARLLLSVAASVPAGEHRLGVDVEYVGCSDDVCLAPSHLLGTAVLRIVAGGEPTPVALPDGPGAAVGSSGPTEDTGMFSGKGPLPAVLFAFVVGFLLTLTPCVYPLIPVTISLIGATAGESKLAGLVHSLVYVLGICLTYSVAGVVAASTGGLFGMWLQHPAVFVALAVVFVLLAGAMFDVFSLDFTSQRLQRVQAGLSGKRGLLGLFGIGLLSGAGVTACIAPVVSYALLYVAQQGSVVLGFFIFFAMAWGFGLPLVALGTFSGLARTLPRPGGWMLTVKHALGLALLAAAAYYLGKSGLLSPFWFTMLVGAMLMGAAVFAGAFDTLTADAGWLPRARKTVGLLFLTASVICFARPFLEPRGPGAPSGRGGIEWVESEPAALALAAAQGKPMLLDFWSEDCSACLKMLRTTFADPRVISESGRFVCAKIDLGSPGDTNEAGRDGADHLRRKYGILGLPTIVLVGSDGRRRVFTEYLGPGRMLEIMRATR